MDGWTPYSGLEAKVPGDVENVTFHRATTIGRIVGIYGAPSAILGAFGGNNPLKGTCTGDGYQSREGYHINPSPLGAIPANQHSSEESQD